MGIKPLEKRKTNLNLLKGIVVIASLVIVGFAYNKYRSTIKINPQVLGEKAVKKIIPEKSFIQTLTEDSKKLFNFASSTVEDKSNLIVGEVRNLIDDTASKAAEAATDTIFQNTVGNLLKQIDKLPQKQQQDIKNQICK